MAKQLESVAALACMTVFLILFNFAFICSGLVMLCVGIWMKLQMDTYTQVGNEMSGAVLLAVASLGALVALIGIFACCCTTRQHPALLYVYGAFLAVIALLELGAGASVYTYRNVLIEGFDRGLNESLAAYGGPDKMKTFHLDLMQKALSCCGNRAYTDYTNMQPPKPIPSSCCSVQEGECDPTDIVDINTEGCYNRVILFVKSNFGLVAGSAFGVAIFPMLGVILACCLASYINKFYNYYDRPSLSSSSSGGRNSRWPQAYNKNPPPMAADSYHHAQLLQHQQQRPMLYRNHEIRSWNPYDPSTIPPRY